MDFFLKIDHNATWWLEKIFFILVTYTLCRGRTTDHWYRNHRDTYAALSQTHPSDEADNIIHLIGWMYKIAFNTKGK